MLKKYRFSLQNVLNHRINLEEERERIFALAMQSLMSEQKKLEYIEAKITKEIHELSVVETRSFSSQDFIDYEKYIVFLENKKTEQQKKICEAKSVVELEREKLIDATKNRKVLERLKEKGMKKYLLDVNRLEQIELDEIAVLKYARIGEIAK